MRCWPQQVGLGVLGVVTEVTLRCVPKHDLIEHTYVATRNHVKEHHRCEKAAFESQL